jgi:rubredoxin
MDKYKCTVCGYIYQPNTGDPEHGFPPGTKFEDLPENWTCPVCGVKKICLKKYEENSSASGR